MGKLTRAAAAFENEFIEADGFKQIGGKPVFGYIDSMVEGGRKREDVVGEITARIPLGIIPPEDDCAKAVLFFVSDYSKVISGGSLDVNGGQYMAP